MSGTGQFWEFTTVGKPRPKGSLKCMGANGGRGRHHMEEDNPESKPWKLKMIRDLREAHGIVPLKRGRLVVGYSPAPYAGPVDVYAEFVFERTVGINGQIWESHSGPISDADDIGDTDKLCRNVGDALEQGGLLANDRQIISWPKRPAKRWVEPGERAHVHVLVVAL